MADDLDRIEALLKRMRDAGKRDDEMRALFGQIHTALADIVDMLAKRPPPADNSAAIAQALSKLQLPAPNVNVQPVVGNDWKRLRVDVQTNRAGDLTGMTFVKE